MLEKNPQGAMMCLTCLSKFLVHRDGKSRPEPGAMITGPTAVSKEEIKKAADRAVEAKVRKRTLKLVFNRLCATAFK